MVIGTIFSSAVSFAVAAAINASAVTSCLNTAAVLTPRHHLHAGALRLLHQAPP